MNNSPIIYFLLSIYQVVQRGQDTLPQWLSYNAEKSSLLGVPSWRDRGDILIDFQSQDGNVLHSLKIEVKDLRDGALQSASRANNTKSLSYSKPKCPKGLPVAAASIVFDYHLEKVTGQTRVDIMNKVHEFVDVDVGNLHMLAGKGHNTAFGLKDVITVTAGPGNVGDSKQPGVVISWQIGCGIDIPIAGKFPRFYLLLTVSLASQPKSQLVLVLYLIWSLAFSRA